MYRQIKTTIAIAMALAFCFSAIAENQKDESPELKAHQAKLKDVFDKLQPVRIYGRVVDTAGSLIHGAEVKLSWQQATLLIGKPDSGGHVDYVMSGKDGCWEFTVKKPHRAFIRDVRKEGYDYGSVKNPEARQNLISHRTSKNNPVVTVLRKKGEATFLFQREGYQLIRVFSPESQMNSLDLLAEKGDKNKSESYADLQVVVNFYEANGWKVIYSATNGTDGIVMSNDMLYEAPLDGYQQEVVLDGPAWPRYLYLRSRTPAIYSRLALEHSIWKESEAKQGFRISYKSWVNPYGSRNLEYDTDLKAEWKLRKQLEKESKSFLKQGKRPKKPDLKALIKAEKEKKK